MNNPIVRLVLIGLLLLMVVAPFAGLAPLMLILLGFGVCWFFWSLVQAFFTADVEGQDDKAGFESSRPSHNWYDS
jgi:putative methionine-R-sulfoxide reductase with GAF domain